MSIVVKKYFAMFTGAQRKWLNSMAEKGYRLIRTDKLEYEFEECKPGQYVYEIEFVGDKSFEHERDYKEFLESFGYRVFYKNINLDYSVGKVTWRPFAEKGGQVSTNETTYNKELLIIEKEKDGRPFELHSTPADKIHYFERLRNPWIIMTAVLLIPAALLQNIVLLILGLLCLIPAIRAHHLIRTCRKEAVGTDAGGSVGESTFIKFFVPIALALIVGCFIYGTQGGISLGNNIKSGSFLGYVENHYKGVFNIKYTRANGTMVRTLSPKNDTRKISADIVTSSGTVAITIESADSHTIIYEFPEDSVNQSITIPTSGEKVIIRITFNSSAGNMSFEYR